MTNTTLEEIANNASDFTIKHIRGICSEKEHNGTLMFLHGMNKPHLDLTSYTIAVMEGIILYEFEKVHGRFPGHSEITSLKSIYQNTLKDLSDCITNFKIEGPVNIIKL